MNAEFNWWLLIVGLVAGAGLVWFVVMDSRRREAEVDSTELPSEAAWLSARLEDEGYDVPSDAAERLLLLHREYLEAPPPDEPWEPDEPPLDDEAAEHDGTAGPDEAAEPDQATERDGPDR